MIFETSSSSRTSLGIRPTIAINNFLRGVGWGREKDVPIPEEWKVKNAHSPFVLNIELGQDAWRIKLNGKLRSDMGYVRAGDFAGPLTLQLYDLLKPRVSLKCGK